MSTRALKPADRPVWLLAMHRWFSSLAIIGTAIHRAALVADSYVQFGEKELFVPMASSWQPGAVAVGDATNRVYQAVALLLTIAAVTATVLRIIVGRSAAQRAPRTSVPGSAPVG